MTETMTLDNKVKQVVSNIRNLPTPPIVFNQIQKVINDQSSSATQVAAILAEDPAMSVKVLKLTNSAFYGLNREIDSVKQAVMIVGMEAIKNLVLSASVLDMFKGDENDQAFQEKFWRHSLATGFCTRALARNVKSRGIVDADSAFSAGLLHDVGKMVIACFLPDENKQLRKAREEGEQSLDHELEDQVLGYNHSQIGGFLALKWKLPQLLSDAITFHHHPQLADSDSPEPYLVHIANYLAKKTFPDDDQKFALGEIEPGVMEYMAVDETDLDRFSEILREEYLKAETFMKMAGVS